MNFTVIWPEAMINELARQYLRAYRAGSGTAFTEAVDRVEGRLASDPFADTESRGSDIRVIIETPVTVYFRVEAGQARVTIIDLLFARPRPR